MATESVLERAQKKLQRSDDTTPAQRPAVTPTPFIRKGDSALSSRPFYLSNLVGALDGTLPKSNAKIEFEQVEWFSKSMRETAGVSYGNDSNLLIPLAWDSLPQQVVDTAEGRVMKSMMTSAGEGYDPDQAKWIVRKATDMSYQNDAFGGSFVAPPEFGEPIELLRNEEVFLKAGARRVALPPQGSIKYPRLTTPTTAYPQPEGTAGTYSDAGSGDVTLTPKAYSVFLRMSNQLAKFAPQLATSMLQADMMKSLALKIDLDALEGAANVENTIKGLINYAGINTVTATTVGANGNTIGRKDGKRMMSKVFAANAKFTGWIMRYELFLNDISELAADAVAAGDKQGAYLFDMFRSIKDNQAAEFNWLKFPVTCSNQVSRSRTKGSATNLTYMIGGDFSDYLLGMHGALELDTNKYSTTAWTNNQQEVRVIGYADGAPRHEASFVLCDQLIQTV